MTEREADTVRATEVVLPVVVEALAAVVAVVTRYAAILSHCPVYIVLLLLYSCTLYCSMTLCT